MRIAVYSGSFNPLHIGHQAIMKYLTEDADFDMVYLIVSPQSPFKDASNNLSASGRYQAAVEAAARHPELRVKVDDIELTMPPPQYSIRTLDALKAREPGNDFTLVVGSDQLAEFRRWRDWRRILLEFGLAVYPRSGYDTGALRAMLLAENPSFRITIARAPMIDISSTQIRQDRDCGLDVSKWLM